MPATAVILSLVVSMSTTGDGDPISGTDLMSSSDGSTTYISGERLQPGTPTDYRSQIEPVDGSPTLPLCRAIVNGRCHGQPFARPEATTPGTPAVTITDLASFAPDAVTLAAEPGNVGIAGMPANFLAEATSHTRSGTLFGQPLSVRFTPVGYDYTYGDGTTATLTSPGRTWGNLGQAQFTPTPTSHVYADRGTYEADVDVRYTAEIDFGAGWQPIAGELTTDGPAQEIRIFEAHTALVAYTCTEKPTAPGC